ncbi:hypothetical protein HYT33_01815 [Candidatus Roizmanbacteria bacterium]|nr:hypothetical protein [Candidatus Roizmanbacteria bacterium]
MQFSPRLLKIFLGVLLLVVSVQLVVFLSFTLFPLRPCQAKTFVKKNAGCYFGGGDTPLQGLYLFLEPKKVIHEKNEVYLFAKYPLFAGLSVPIKFRVGNVYKNGYALPVCKVIGDQYESAHTCRSLKERAEVSLGKFRRDIVLLKLLKDNSLFKEDPYIARCGAATQKLFSAATRGQGVGSVLPLFMNKSCSPTASQIFY